jgi:hypothetical protein
MYNRKAAISDYEAEVATAVGWRDEGRTSVSAEVAGKELARGRTEVPIEEYITYWLCGLKALKNGVNTNSYNY